MAEQTPDPTVPVVLPIDWPETEPAPYANQLMFATDGSVVYLTFGQAGPPSGPATTAVERQPQLVKVPRVKVQVAARVVMTPQSLRSIVQTLQQAILFMDKLSHASTSSANPAT